MTTIPHGYTHHDLDRLAHLAAVSAHSGGLDSATSHALAWSGIAEHLCTAEHAPSRQDLIRAGQRAVNDELAACLHARGYKTGNTRAGPAASPRWTMYWHTAPEPGPTDRLIEHYAAIQIAELLTPAERQAVEALAIHDDHQHAAEALGIPAKTFASRLSTARRRFLAAWFAPETTPRARRIDRRSSNKPPRTHCSAGHLLEGENLRIQVRRGGKRERCCRTCERNRKTRVTPQQAAA